MPLDAYSCAATGTRSLRLGLATGQSHVGGVHIPWSRKAAVTTMGSTDHGNLKYSTLVLSGQVGNGGRSYSVAEPRLSPQQAAALSLLRTLTAPEEAARAEALRGLSRTADWPRLVEWVQAQHLAPLAYHSLREAEAGLVPDEELVAFRQAYSRAAAEATMRRRELIRIVRLLRTQRV